jgi:hypothetical protein
MNKVSIVFLIALIGMFLSPGSISAQSASDFSIPSLVPDVQEQISLDVEPRVPKPGDKVTVTLSAYGTDLNQANITWTYNGKESLKGVGEKVFEFIASKVGTQNTIKATIVPTGGPTITKTFSFTPAEVDLLWEASTYTPPFYKGKALFTPQADVTFVALPNLSANGSSINESQAVYKWKTDYRVEGDKSGAGKNTFKYTGPIILRPHLIQVEAYAQKDSSVKALNGVELIATDPQAYIYEDHPLYGILFNKTIYSFEMNDREKKFVAYPLFFSTNNKNNRVTYQWNLNDSIITAPENQNYMGFRKTDQNSADVRVRVRINSIDKLLQEATKEFSLFFNTNSSIFLRQ